MKKLQKNPVKIMLFGERTAVYSSVMPPTEALEENNQHKQNHIEVFWYSVYIVYWLVYIGIRLILKCSRLTILLCWRKIFVKAVFRIRIRPDPPIFSHWIRIRIRRNLADPGSGSSVEKILFFSYLRTKNGKTWVILINHSLTFNSFSP